MKFWPKTSLGIDVSDSCINLALLKTQDKGVKVLKTASAPLPEGVIEDGNIKDPRTLAKAIAELRTKNRICAHYVTLSLVAEPTLVQLLELPENVPGNIRQFICDEVKHFAVLPINSVAVDYCGIKQFTESAQHRVLVVATDNQKVVDVAKALSREGLTVDAVEPPWLAYLRTCYTTIIANKPTSNLMFVMANEHVVTFCVFRNRGLDFVRTQRCEPGTLGTETFCDWLTEQIIAIMKFYELELPDSNRQWQLRLTPSGNFVKEKTQYIQTRLREIQMDVTVSTDTVVDTTVVANTPAERSVVAVGLAMKLLNFPKWQLNINLLPSEIIELRTVHKQALITANVAAVIFFVMMLAVGLLNAKVKKLSRSFSEGQLSRREVSTLTLLDKRATLDEQITEASETINNIETFIGNACVLNWSQILNKISAAIPKTVQITNLSSSGDCNLLMEGRALSYEAVQVFVDMLHSCKDIAAVSLLESKRDDKFIGVIRYSVNCSLVR